MLFIFLALWVLLTVMECIFLIFNESLLSFSQVDTFLFDNLSLPPSYDISLNCSESMDTGSLSAASHSVDSFQATALGQFPGNSSWTVSRQQLLDSLNKRFRWTSFGICGKIGRTKDTVRQHFRWRRISKYLLLYVSVHTHQVACMFTLNSNSLSA